VHVPTYPYACTACDHRFEQVQAFSDPSLTECPVCGGRLRKVFSSVGIVFKGSGFYRTDARAGAGSSDKGEKGEKAGAASGSGESSGSGGASADSGSSTGSSTGSSNGTSNGSGPSTSAAASSSSSGAATAKSA
jgi:putative FmdB family regulatory protein